MGIFQNPFFLSLLSCINIFQLCLIVTYCDFKTAVHPPSHILTFETSDLFVIFGKIWPSNVSYALSISSIVPINGLIILKVNVIVFFRSQREPLYTMKYCGCHAICCDEVCCD